MAAGVRGPAEAAGGLQARRRAEAKAGGRDQGARPKRLERSTADTRRSAVNIAADLRARRAADSSPERHDALAVVASASFAVSVPSGLTLIRP